MWTAIARAINCHAPETATTTVAIKTKTKDNNNKLKGREKERKVDRGGRERERETGGTGERGYSSMLALKATGNKTCQPLTIIES